MHYLVKNNLHDIEYLKTFTDFNSEFMAHLEKKTPDWASSITGIKDGRRTICKLLRNNPRSYFRLGYGFTRQKNGASNMHAVASLPAILGSWKYKGGGALMNNGSIYHWDKTLIEGLDCIDTLRSDCSTSQELEKFFWKQRSVTQWTTSNGDAYPKYESHVRSSRPE